MVRNFQNVPKLEKLLTIFCHLFVLSNLLILTVFIFIEACTSSFMFSAEFT